jgi:hypothetical protein
VRAFSDQIETAYTAADDHQMILVVKGAHSRTCALIGEGTGLVIRASGFEPLQVYKDGM